MNILSLRVELHLEGPILTGATNPGEFAVDSPFARLEDQDLYFPGTLIKGKLRQAWSCLAGMADELPKKEEIPDWLGARAGNRDAPDESFDPSRGKAYFSNFVAVGSKVRKGLRSRIRMDVERGAADDGMLQLLESPYGSGETGIFTGTVNFFGKGPEECKKFQLALDLGLRAIPSFGAERGVGFGRLQKVVVSQEPAGARATDPLPVAECVGVVISSEDLLCFATAQPAQNIFTSGKLIPGGVLKGSLAQMMEDCGGKNAFPRLHKHLSAIRIKHARPVPEGVLEIPPAIPLSIVSANNDWKDAVHAREAQLLNSATPVFQTDWKPKVWAVVNPYFGVTDVPTELRVRTAHDPETRRAKDEQLFAYESLKPKGFQWLTSFDLHQVPEGDRPAVCEELRKLLEFGLFGVGKTKARLKLELRAALPTKFKGDITADGQVVVQLQTAALLGAPKEWEKARTASDVEGIYRAAWLELSGQGLKLTNYFAAQEFAGGYYLHRRFRKGKPYQPWMLTSAGSVFVFDVTDRVAAEAKLEEFVNCGLPLEAAVREANELGNDPFEWWRTLPYVRENGFGEVGVNMDRNWSDRCLR